MIAAYATVDAIGVRLAGDVGVYAAWICLIYGALLPAAFVAIRGWLVLDVRSPETLKALAGGMVSLLAYGPSSRRLRSVRSGRSRRCGKPASSSPP